MEAAIEQFTGPGNKDGKVTSSKDSVARANGIRVIGSVGWMILAGAAGGVLADVVWGLINLVGKGGIATAVFALAIGVTAFIPLGIAVGVLVGFVTAVVRVIFVTVAPDNGRESLAAGIAAGGSALAGLFLLIYLPFGIVTPWWILGLAATLAAGSGVLIAVKRPFFGDNQIKSPELRA